MLVGQFGPKWTIRGYERSEAALSDFIGGFIFSVDDKGRFNVPAPHRLGLAASADKTFVVAPGPEGCLDAYPLDEWVRHVRKLRRIPNKKLGRYYKRVILAPAKRCKLDGHNRILVPPDLLRSVGIKAEVFILGQLDHIELWDPRRYQSISKERKMPLEDALEQIEDELNGNGPSSRE
jgi:MraZ protein